MAGLGIAWLAADRLGWVDFGYAGGGGLSGHERCASSPGAWIAPATSATGTDVALPACPSTPPLSTRHAPLSAVRDVRDNSDPVESFSASLARRTMELGAGRWHDIVM